MANQCEVGIISMHTFRHLVEMTERLWLRPSAMTSILDKHQNHNHYSHYEIGVESLYSYQLWEALEAMEITHEIKCHLMLLSRW